MDPGAALQALRDATDALAEGGVTRGELLDAALAGLVRVAEADAGAIAPSPSAGEADPRILVRRPRSPAISPSHAALRAAFGRDVTETVIEQPPRSWGVAAAAITSVLLAPVRRQGRTVAAVYLDRRGPDRPAFDETARRLTDAFAAMLGMALRLAELVELEGGAGRASRKPEAIREPRRFGDMATRSPAVVRCFDLAEKAVRYGCDVLILGETGTGKEHLARCIHALSPRRTGPFVAVNCAALPRDIVESELFGHERGAVTGAHRRRRGILEVAAGGTVFLDEVADLHPEVQPKLLRVVESRRLTRVGGSEEMALDVRIIAATNRDLGGEMAAARFREDLYYRLSAVPLVVPPLRERPEDVPHLALELLGRTTRELGRADVSGWEPEAVRRLLRDGWPGNVRELRNAVTWLCLQAEGPTITAGDVEGYFERSRPAGGLDRPGGRRGGAGGVEGTGGLSLREARLGAAREAERAALERALRATRGSAAGAAKLLGVSRARIYARLREQGLRPRDFWE